MSNPVIHRWHNPRNDTCAQNSDIDDDCTCLRVVAFSGKKRAPKSKRIVRVGEGDNRFVLELFDNGKILIRRHGKRIRYETSAAKLHRNLLWNHAMACAAQVKARRNERRKSFKISRKKRQRMERARK